MTVTDVVIVVAILAAIAVLLGEIAYLTVTRRAWKRRDK